MNYFFVNYPSTTLGTQVSKHDMGHMIQKLIHIYISCASPDKHSPRQIHGVGVRQRNRTRTVVGAIADAWLASELSGGGASGAAAVAGGLVTACTTTYAPMQTRVGFDNHHYSIILNLCSHNHLPLMCIVRDKSTESVCASAIAHAPPQE